MSEEKMIQILGKVGRISDRAQNQVRGSVGWAWYVRC